MGKRQDDHAIGFGMRAAGVCLRLAIPGILLCVLSGSAAAAQGTAKNVLVLSGGHGSVSIPIMEASLRRNVPWPVNFSVADLETPPFDNETHLEVLAEAFRHKFGDKKVDLVIAVMDTSLRFALRYRDKMFPGVPITFMSISSPEASRVKFRWPGVTGVASAVGIKETIDLALRLHPDTKAVAVITSQSTTENDYLAAVQAELLRYQDKLTEIDLVGPPSGQMIEKIAALPPHTAALFQIWPHESDQPALGVYDVLAETTQHLPTYCIFPGLCMNHGGIGGAYDDARNDAVVAGEIAARVLKGERPDDIPIASNANLVATVDWRELRRWKIPESELPAGTVILNREPTLWEKYKNYIIPAIAIIVAQFVLIAALLWQRARKQKAEAVLRESEKRFRLMADTTPALIWMCDSNGKVTYLNDRRIAFTGRDPQAGYFDAWTRYVHPDDRKRVREINTQAMQSHRPFSKEYRLRRKDGAYRWMLDVASPRVNGDGSFAGFIGAAIDTTDQKIAQNALEKVSGQLIEAQEKERRRIARDLHDDICQRLALLSMELDQAAQESNRLPGASAKRLEEIQKHCVEIANDVQSLSHQLHSPKLAYLGVVAAIKGFCTEFSKQYEVIVDFKDRNVPRRLAKDISLCLFRIVQEALHNAVKYSGEGRFSVELSATSEAIRLVVSDAGVGFDVEEAKNNRGLGLLSMQERAHLVHGFFSINSAPGEGTRIVVRVPLAAEGAAPEGSAVEQHESATR